MSFNPFDASLHALRHPSTHHCTPFDTLRRVIACPYVHRIGLRHFIVSSSHPYHNCKIPFLYEHIMTPFIAPRRQRYLFLSYISSHAPTLHIVFAPIMLPPVFTLTLTLRLALGSSGLSTLPLMYTPASFILCLIFRGTSRTSRHCKAMGRDRMY